MTVELVGLTGDTRGLENRLTEMAPLVVRSQAPGSAVSVMAAPGLDWSLDRLVETSTGDDRYMHFVRPTTDIEPGQTVWIAGPSFFKQLRGCSATREEALRIGAWRTLPGGFRWARGLRREFHELSEAIANRVAPALHRSLFDSLEKSHGDAASLFNLFEAVGAERTQERLLDRALYFYETRDVHSYDWVREQSIVIDRAFTDIEHFERSFQARRDWLKSVRWSESALTVPPASGRHAHPSIPLDELLRARAELFEYLQSREREITR